jgi:penicillin-insensitive murein endopeptidase
MISGHSSHQIGLDVDIWFKPMPAHVLSREER